MKCQNLFPEETNYKIHNVLMYFFRKQVLTFVANCLLRRQFATNVKTYLLKKQMRKCINTLSAYFVYSVCKLKKQQNCCIEPSSE